MQSKDYMQLLANEYDNKELSKDDFISTLKHYAELYHKEQTMQQPINNNKQQTTVEWLSKKTFIPAYFLERAKEIEKDKMENLWHEAISHGGCKCYDEIMTFKQYYSETFNK